MGILPDDITSTQISIVPEYEWRHGEEARRKGTSVSRVVTIILRDLSKYNELLNGLVNVPISSLRKVEMDVVGRDDFERSALLQAIRNAKRTAEAAATELEMTLGHVQNVETRQRYSIMGTAQRALDEGNSFEIGTIEIEKEVVCTFHLLKPE